MNGRRWLYIGLVAGAVLTLGFLLAVPKQESLAGYWTVDAQGSLPAVGGPSSLNDLAPFPPADLGSDEVPPADLTIRTQSVNVLPTPIPGETQVYFVPTDNDATATVLYLYNTENITHVVALRGFAYNGVLVYSLNVTVKPTSFLRLSSDSIVAAPPPSWATPAPVIANFTDFTYFASLSLPRGVKVEGYTLFNPGTGVVDPRVDQGAVPLRFSTDPATVFLPAVDNGS